MDDDVLTLIGLIGLLIISIIFLPMICFGFAWIGGWICKITFGSALCKALNILVGSTFFTPDMLPWVAEALGWIGGYFKCTISKKN